MKTADRLLILVIFLLAAGCDVVNRGVAAWDAIELGGSLRGNGMPAFGAILSKEDSDAVRAFVIDEARKAR